MEIYLLNEKTENNQTSFRLWSWRSMDLWNLKSSPLLLVLCDLDVQYDSDESFWIDVSIPSNQFEEIIEDIRRICTQMDVCFIE